MINLVIKDILVQKKGILFAFGYSFFMIFAFQQMADMAFVTSTIAVVYILILTAFAYEDKNKTEVMLNSLPISRRDIVLAKYLSVFVYIALGLLAYMASATIIRISGLPLKVANINLPGVLGLLVAVGILSSLHIPLIFKFGYIKAKIFNLVIFMLFFFIPNFIAGFYKKNKDNEYIQRFILSLQERPEWEIASFIVIIVLLIMAVSYMISLRIYNNKEF